MYVESGIIHHSKAKKTHIQSKGLPDLTFLSVDWIECAGNCCGLARYDEATARLSSEVEHRES